MQASYILRYMRFAIEEGRKAVPHCGNNPPVGCVLVQDGEVVARGHTGSPGSPHAEAMAINQLKLPGDHVIAFVTLEPCSFFGRTPSCAEGLIAAGIKTIYVGTLDPDERNNGRGIVMLRNAGIAVHIGILEEEIYAELKDYLGKAP